jgi:tetratricopeptide (TPR) repeat protein
MTRQRRSLQDLIHSRQQSSFVGRQGQLVQYQENLNLPVDDERRRFLFNIHGDAGVGKTYLTKQLRRIAAGRGCLTAYVDETAEDVISAMTVMADEFRRAGARLAEFDKRVAAYQERRHELESDKNAPDGIAAFLTKTAVIIGLAAARDVPVAGSLLAPVDAAGAADQVNRARAYLTQKFSDHADVRLLLSPADELTPVFVSGIDRVAAGRPVALFFDTYERSGQVLDSWLRRLYDGQYGDLPETLVTTISGQNPLNPNLWGDYLTVIADVRLEPFSDAEARQFLASKNLDDNSTIEVILTLSGRLPMWLATLAEARPADAADVGDPAGDAVERFLKWEDDPARRAIAMTAALPRVINQDVLAAVTPPGEARELFGWLSGLPFVSGRGKSWVYHEVVRAAMLRLQLAQAPSQWRANQVTLAQANACWARDAAGQAEEFWANSSWAHYDREEMYHLLCADPAGNLPRALASAVRAAEVSAVRARQWAQVLADAGRDADDFVLSQWGQRLRDGIHDNDLTRYLTCLINDAQLEKSSLAVALEERGEGHRLAARNDDALADFDRAIELNPTAAWAIGSRGQTYHAMGRWNDALADYSRAFELRPDQAWAIAYRAETHRLNGQYGDALADFDRAIELNPSDAWAIARRGQTHHAIGRWNNALADYTRAIELDPSQARTIAYRGEICQLTGRYGDALADFDRAIKLDPDDPWATASRGQTYLLTKQYDQALADFNRAIELHPSYERAIELRGQTYRAMGRDREARADHSRAAEFDPSYEPPMV